MEEIRKDFYELRHKFSKKEKDKYRKAFYDIKMCRDLSASEMKNARKRLTKLKENLRFKKFYSNVDSFDYDDLDNYDDNYDYDDLDNYDDNYEFDDDDEYKKIGSIRALFNKFDRDY